MAFISIGNLTLLTGIIVVLSLLFSAFNELRYANTGTSFGNGCCARGDCGQQGIDNVMWWGTGAMIVILTSVWAGMVAVIFSNKQGSKLSAE
jgi:hypothetical protein